MTKRVLIVEDDHDTRVFLKKRFESDHFECVCAESVEEGLKDLQTKKPNLVILDLGFRRANGTAFLQSAGEWTSPKGAIPPIIVLSGFSDPEIVDYVMAQGAAGFIPKPYDSNALMSLAHDCVA